MNNVIIALIVLCLIPAWANASPGQSGSSGLLAVPSAETLDAGNICVGTWMCSAQNSSFSQKNSLIMPVAITMGIGTFWEVYGAYPNIIFNGDDDVSGRGTMDLGTKLRFLGGRTSDFKMAVDLLFQRHISESRKIDGATDTSARLITSYNKNDFGIHVSAGYLQPGAVSGFSLESEYIFGGGVEYMIMPRVKLLGEVTAGTNRYSIEDRDKSNSATLPWISAGHSLEASVGVQYFLTPHLTLNASVGKGFGANDADSRFLFGISSCQGIGTYVKPIPTVGRRAAAKDKTREALKPLKIIPISSLLLKPSAPLIAPVSTLEVEADNEEILIKPYGQIAISPQQASSNLTSPVIPVEIQVQPSNEEVTLKTEDRESRAIEYTLKRISGITQLYRIDVKAPQVALPSDVIPERLMVYRKFLFPDVIFEFNQSTLSSAGKKMFSEVAEKIRKDAKWLYVKIDGHTDNIGSSAYNFELSLKRAIEAAGYLISHEGIDHTKIFIEGRGMSAPIADNATAVGRRSNRRTEILLLVAKEVQ